MYKKCQHLNIEISEYGEWRTYHNREINGTWSHAHVPGNYGKFIFISCKKCGFNKRYNRYKVPKWLQLYMEEFSNSKEW